MTGSFLRFMAAAALLAFSSAVLGGCNTFEGLGKDVEAGGKAVSGSAREVKKKL